MVWMRHMIDVWMGLELGRKMGCGVVVMICGGFWVCRGEVG